MSEEIEGAVQSPGLEELITPRASSFQSVVFCSLLTFRYTMWTIKVRVMVGVRTDLKLGAQHMKKGGRVTPPVVHMHVPARHEGRPQGKQKKRNFS